MQKARRTLQRAPCGLLWPVAVSGCFALRRLALRRQSGRHRRDPLIAVEEILKRLLIESVDALPEKFQHRDSLADVLAGVADGGGSLLSGFERKPCIDEPVVDLGADCAPAAAFAFLEVFEKKIERGRGHGAYLLSVTGRIRHPRVSGGG